MFEKLEEIRNYLFKYLETRIDLLKTEAQDSLEKMAIQIIYLVVLLLLASMTGIFAFMMLAVLLNEWLESRYAGFAIVFGALLILTAFWIKAGDWVHRAVRQLLYHIFRKKQL
jgi:protein-S-isoprenylcysteine O-methyltransferase Ste14